MELKRRRRKIGSESESLVRGDQRDPLQSLQWDTSVDNCSRKKEKTEMTNENYLQLQKTQLSTIHGQTQV